MKNSGGNIIAGALRLHSRKWTASPLLKHPGLFGKVTLATDVFYHKNPFDRGAYLTCQRLWYQFSIKTKNAKLESSSTTVRGHADEDQKQICNSSW